MSNKEMGSEGNNSPSAPAPAPAASTMASPSGKRSRDPENEVYLDNLHSHKRYLSEMMASSLNGLTVGDPLSENLMDSPERSDRMLYLRDELSSQHSPLFEDSDDSRYFETSTNTCSSQPESTPTSPVSPYRCPKSPSGFALGPPSTSYPPHGSVVSSMTSSQLRQRGSDTEGQILSSPSDICYSADLRRAALLRSVQMRTQPPGSSQYESGYSSGQETGPNMEIEELPCSYTKAIIDGRENQIEECMRLSISECENQDKPMNLKGDESAN